MQREALEQRVEATYIKSLAESKIDKASPNTSAEH